MVEQHAMLSTKDNPWNPFTNWDEWFAFDVGHGYHCCNVLAMFSRTSDSLSDADNSLEISNTIDEIIKYDTRKIFKKVFA